MKKRILMMLMAVCVAASAFALSFTGKTYRGEKNGAVLTISFTSASRGTMALRVNGKTEKMAFRYEESGDILNLDMPGGGFDYIYTDPYHEYGDDCIYVVDPYGNPYIILNRVSTPAGTTTKKKARRK